MPDNVSLNIPVDIRTPGQYIEIDQSKADTGLPSQPRRLLVIGQRLATGTQAAGTPVRVTSAAQAESYFGQGSMLARMLAALYRTDGQYANDVWALALDDAGAATAATREVSFTTVAGVSAGTLSLYIAGVRVAVRVTAGMEVWDLAAAVAEAINAKGELPVTAEATEPDIDPAIVTLTARNAGECGSDIDVRANYYAGERLPDGLDVTIAAATPGTGNPDISDALAAIDDSTYTTLVVPWSDGANMALLEEELEDRWGPLEQRTGHAFTAHAGGFADITAWGSDRNSVHVTCLGLGPSPTWVPEQAAALAAVCEYYGAIDPARPFQTLALDGVLPPAVEARFSRSERDLMLHDGISTATVDDGGVVRIERVITTYQTRNGVEDTSLLDLETKWTVDYIRYAVRARIALRFPRHKLANDDTRFAAGQAIVTPKLIRAELMALFRDLEDVGLVEGFAQFKRDLVVVRSTADPHRVNAIIPPDVINQFRVFAAAVQFRL